MNLGNRIRKIWHDGYYSIVSEGGVLFALRCKEVAEIVDLKEKNLSLAKRFRFFLHLSLCQSCKNYENLQIYLKALAKKTFSKENPTIDLSKMNETLLDKFSKKGTD